MMTWTAVFQSPLEAFPAYVDRQDARLTLILVSPPRPIHHPEEGWLDPSHPVLLERRRDEGSMSQRSTGNLVGICLVDTDSSFVVNGANLLVRGFFHL